MRNKIFLTFFKTSELRQNMYILLQSNGYSRNNEKQRKSRFLTKYTNFVMVYFNGTP